MDLFPGEQFTVLVGNFGNRALHIPKHTVVGLAFPSPTYIRQAKEGGGNKNKSSAATEEHTRRKRPATGENRINSVRTNECARCQRPVTDDGKIKSSTDGGGCARREEPDMDDADSGNPANADEQTDTDAEKKRAWEEDVHIGAEDSTVRSEIMDMLSEFKDMWSGCLGKIDATKHGIELKPGARPIYQAPHRAGPIARQKEKKKMDRMLRAGVIEPTSAGWASSVVFVPKKDGTMRFCVEYGKLNVVTVRDSYPLPRMDECMDSLGDATVFTTLDCNSGYWQVEIAKEDRDKTTFASHSGLYRFLRMPFGLKNAPATFQRAVDIIVSRVKWETALVYFDDVIVYLRTVTEHMAHVREVLRLLHTEGVSLKLAKYTFFRHFRNLSRARHPSATVGGGATQCHCDRVHARAYEPNGTAIFSRDVQSLPTVCPRVREYRRVAEQDDQQESALLIRGINRYGICGV